MAVVVRLCEVDWFRENGVRRSNRYDAAFVVPPNEIENAPLGLRGDWHEHPHSHENPKPVEALRRQAATQERPNGNDQEDQEGTAQAGGEPGAEQVLDHGRFFFC
jgi:hypothetical protein